MDYKDKASKDFMVALEKMRLEAVRLFSKLKDKLTAVELQAVIASKMEKFVLEELKFMGELDKLMLAYDTALKGTAMFAEVSEVTLGALRNINKASWVTQAKFEIGAIQKEIFNASITNQWNQKAIMNNLMTGVHGNLTEGQVNTLIDTSLSTYERNVTTAMMKEMPDDAKYVYVGPLDALTRDICNDMIGAGELTEAEIISNFGSDVLEIGGGHNCRHMWTLA